MPPGSIASAPLTVDHPASVQSRVAPCAQPSFPQRTIPSASKTRAKLDPSARPLGEVRLCASVIGAQRPSLQLEPVPHERPHRPHAWSSFFKSRHAAPHAVSGAEHVGPPTVPLLPPSGSTGGSGRGGNTIGASSTTGGSQLARTRPTR